MLTITQIAALAAFGTPVAPWYGRHLYLFDVLRCLRRWGLVEFWGAPVVAGRRGSPGTFLWGSRTMHVITTLQGKQRQCPSETAASDGKSNIYQCAPHVVVDSWVANLFDRPAAVVPWTLPSSVAASVPCVHLTDFGVQRASTRQAPPPRFFRRAAREEQPPR